MLKRMFTFRMLNYKFFVSHGNQKDIFATFAIHNSLFNIYYAFNCNRFQLALEEGDISQVKN